MKLTKKLYILAIAAALLLVTGIAALQVEAERPHERSFAAPSVLWMDEEKGKTIFVSESTLNEESLSNHPSLEYFRTRLRMKREPEMYKHLYHGQIIPECEGRMTRSPQGAATLTKSLSEIILGKPAAFVGRVEQLVPGWDSWHEEVAMLAYLEVEEVIHSNSPTPAPVVGQRIGVLFSGGSIAIHGTIVCDKIDESFYSPRLDDRVIVTGAGWKSDARFFVKSEVFPMVGDEILPQPYPSLQEAARSDSLTNLRSLSVARFKTRRNQ